MRRKNINEQLHTQPQFRLKPVYAAVLLAVVVQTAQANPIGGTVAAGQASFATTGNTLNVTNTPGTIINWQGFSIGANEITHFVQQSASSSVLNRVISNNPSSILGTLQSNGRVFLINPGGIVFGAGATVDVAGMVASTLNLSNADFLAGRNHFTQVPGSANVSNAGNITAHGDGQNGGQIYLIAPDVENTGVITAPNGEILLVAGYSVDLVSTTNPNLRVNITAPAGDATNVGQLIAQSGSLGLFGTVVRNSGTVSADSATMQGGKIVFRASQRTEISGTVSANGTTGGTIEALGNQVGIMDGATVTANGTQGGGTILVGGDYQGKNPDVPNAQVTYVAPTATLSADGGVPSPSGGGLGWGNGGKVIVWADDTTRAYGSISVRGGDNGGNGGFVETSGRKYLDVTRNPDIAAPLGKSGEWLLDPESITISSAASANNTGASPFRPATMGASTLNYAVLRAAIVNGGTVTVDTTCFSTCSGTTGNILVDTTANLANMNIVVSTPAILNLFAHNDITINSSITSTGSPLQMNLTTGSTGNIAVGPAVQLIANNDSITMSGFGINIGTGAKVSTGSTGGAGNGSADLNLTAAYGGIVLSTGSSLLANQNINVTANGVLGSITAGGTIGYVTGTPTGGTITLSSSGLITLNAALTANATTGMVSITGVGVTNTSTITGPGGVNINAGIGLLSNKTGTSVITNGGGVATGPVNLTADAMSLAGGTITGGAGLVTLGASTPARVINLGGTGTGGTLDILGTDLRTITTTGGLSIGDTANTGGITVNGAITAADLARISGSLTLSNVGSIAVNAALASPVPVALSTAFGAISESETGGSITAPALMTSAYGGIILNGANSVGSFDAVNFTSGNIELTNTATMLAIGDISNYAYSGGIAILNTGDIDFASTTNGGVVASWLNGTATLTATGKITKSSSSVLDVYAGSISLNAANGIGSSTSPIMVNDNPISSLRFNNTGIGDVFISSDYAMHVDDGNNGGGNITLVGCCSSGLIQLNRDTGNVTASGDITYVADNFNVSGTGTFGKTISGTGAANYVQVMPYTAGQSIVLDHGTIGTYSGSPLLLTQSTLDLFNSPKLIIGSPTAGDILITNTLGDSTNLIFVPRASGGVDNVTLSTGGSVNFDLLTAVGLVAPSITVDAGVNVSHGLAAADFDTSAYNGNISITAGGTIGSSITGDDVVLNAGSGAVSLTANGIFLQQVDARSLIAHSLGDITLSASSALNLSGTGSALVLDATGNFVNNNATTPFNLTGAGARWLVYSTAPGLDTGIPTLTASDFMQYGAVYVTALGQATGNGLIYSTTPSSLGAVLGPKTKVYDGTTSINLAASDFTVYDCTECSVISSLTVAPLVGSYDNKNVGSGKVVTATISVLIDGTTGAKVYGYPVYQWGVYPDAPVTNNASSITSATVTLITASDAPAIDEIVDITNQRHKPKPEDEVVAADTSNSKGPDLQSLPMCRP